jgi:hypothetical protein
MISACAGQCYFDYINLVRNYIQLCLTLSLYFPALVWARNKSLFGAFPQLTRISKCRSTFAEFQSYVESAHSQFPVSPLCACGIYISQPQTPRIINSSSQSLLFRTLQVVNQLSKLRCSTSLIILFMLSCIV